MATQPAPIERAPSAYAYPLLIKQLLHTPLANAADQVIVASDGSRYSYARFAERVAQLAHVLGQLDVAAGDTVAVMGWDSPQYLEAYFAVPMIGAALMMVNIRLSDEQIAYTLDHCGAQTLLVHPDFLGVLAELRDRLPRLKRVVVLGGEADADRIEALREGLPRWQVHGYEPLMERAATAYSFADFDENACATTFYTTGTTGLPKAVYFSHRQIVLHTLSVATGLASAPAGQRFHRDDVYMPLTPMFHVHAWGMPYVATLLGVKQVYAGRYMAEHILSLIRQEGVTFSHGVPTVLKLVLDAARGEALQGWKVVAGGSVLPPGLCDQALVLGVDIFTGYGMSEACPFITIAQQLPGRPAAEAQATDAFRLRAGWAAPLVELRLVDDAMRDVPRDGESLGEVVVRAPWLTQGYLGNSEASQALWRGGWMHTNDIGRIDGRGCLRLVDRLKDVIKTGGEWVSSLDLEQLISEHPGVSEVAVIGVSSEQWGERPMAIVVAKPEFADTLTEEELRQRVARQADAGRISRYAIPDHVRIVAAIEKTSVGKFDKKALRRKYGAAQPG